MRWQKKLNKKELAHVRKRCRGTLAGLKRAREFQKEKKEKFPEMSEPCWECRMIARKLGLET